MGQLRYLEGRHPAATLDELLDRLAPLERPRSGLVRALRALPPRRLDQLIDRHANGAVDPRKPGVPDLAVYKQGSRPCAFRFVEVKRPDERLLPHQAAEIRFMRSIGLRAGVFRLKESNRS